MNEWIVSFTPPSPLNILAPGDEKVLFELDFPGLKVRMIVMLAIGRGLLSFISLLSVPLMARSVDMRGARLALLSRDCVFDRLLVLSKVASLIWKN